MSTPESPSNRSRRKFLAAGLTLAGAGAVGAAGLALSPVGHRLYHDLFSAPAGQRTGGAQTTPTSLPTETPRPLGTTWPWTFSPRNPVLDIVPHSLWENSAVYDPCVVRLDDGALWMWYSTRGTKPFSIALAIDQSGTGDQWVRVGSTPVLTPDPPERYPYGAITRPSVVKTPDGWRMFYSTAWASGGAGAAWIGMATSTDGIHWQKHGAPVLTPTAAWEKQALQCPNVLYDAQRGRYLLWYCGGDFYEPDAVGFATSPDGVSWTRASSNPIFAPTTGWEGYKVGSFQVHGVGDWYYAFYNAFQRSPFRSHVGMARSRDGITNWEHHPMNPLLSPGPRGTWDAAMIYKPTALWNAQVQRWDLWFNASEFLNRTERIGHAWSDRIW